MTERIESGRVLDSSAVGDVRRETTFEHFMRVMAPPAQAVMAYLILSLILAFCGYIMVFGSGDLGGFRTAAWSVISGVAGAVGSKLFGGRIIAKSQE
jgi:hypothetical protein